MDFSPRGGGEPGNQRGGRTNGCEFWTLSPVGLPGRGQWKIADLKLLATDARMLPREWSSVVFQIIINSVCQSLEDSLELICYRYHSVI